VWCFLEAPILDLGLGTDCVEVSSVPTVFSGYYWNSRLPPSRPSATLSFHLAQFSTDGSCWG